jgi:hypothetical protein
MKHFRALSTGPRPAQAPSLGNIFALFAGIINVLATAIVAKENAPPPQWPGTGGTAT